MALSHFCALLRAASGAVQPGLNAVKRAIPSRLGRPLSPFHLSQPHISRFPFIGAATTSLARLDSSCFVLPSKVTQATKSRWAPGPVESSGVGCLVSSTALDIGWFGGNLGLVLRSTDPNKAMIRRHQGVPVCPFRLVLTQRPRYEPRIMCLTTYASFTGPRASLYVRVSPLFSPFM